MRPFRLVIAALRDRCGVTATEYAVFVLGVLVVVASVAYLVDVASNPIFSRAIATL